MSTVPADQVLLGKHLGAAAGHLRQAVSYTEKLSVDVRFDTDAVCESRAELKGIVGRWRPA